MNKVANYIKSIEIESLWSGKKHVRWELNPGVNILSGVNGVGKSTILNRVIMHLLNIDKAGRSADGVKIEYDVEGAECVDFDVIRSFDRPILSGDILNKVTDTQLQTELDFHIYLLQRRYLDFQVSLHVEWQQQLVSLIRDLNPNAQIILTTHSPAVIMNGWADCVTDVEDIVS